MPLQSERAEIAGIPLDPMGLDEAVGWICARAAARDGFAIVTTVNMSFLTLARTNAPFAGLLRRTASLNLVDGAPVLWLLRVAGHRSALRAPGSDLTRALLQAEATTPLGVYLLGDSPTTLAAVGARAAAEGWRQRIRGMASPMPGEIENDRTSVPIVDAINQSGADVLLVAFGAPRQELWMQRWAHALRPAVGIGIGGSLKFVAWPRRRAPYWLRRVGLEWLFRLALEPRRLISRYSRDALELVRLVVEVALMRKRPGASRRSG